MTTRTNEAEQRFGYFVPFHIQNTSRRTTFQRSMIHVVQMVLPAGTHARRLLGASGKTARGEIFDLPRSVTSTVTSI